MTKQYNLESMFNPRSVALIGASSDFSKLSGRPVRFLIGYGFKGGIYLVNPRRTEIAGHKCYPSVRDIPGNVDLAVIMLQARAVPAVLRDCGKKGVKAVVVISAGFSEAGVDGERLNGELCSIAREYNIALCGPNCSGLINVFSNTTASFSVGIENQLPAKGPVAFISQSGALASYVLGAAASRNLGFCYWVSTGNEVILNYTDYLNFMLDRQETGLVMGYMEDARDGDAFQECARKALQLGKPLVLIKVGRTKAAAKAGALHTRSATGDDRVYTAVFHRYGVIRVENLEEMMDVAALAQCERKPRGNRIHIFSVSGGLGVLMADTAARLGFEFSELTPTTKEHLREILPPLAVIANPVDTTADILFMPGCLKEAIRLILKDENVDNLVIFLGIQPWEEREVARDIAEIAKESSKYIMVVKFPCPPQEYYDLLGESKVPVLAEPVRALESLAKIIRYSSKREAFAKARGETGSDRADHGRQVAELLKSVRVSGRISLTETEGKTLLETWGLDCAEPAQGGALEVVVGTKQDPCFGPVVTLGLGGIFGPVARELVVHPAPLTTAEARELIEQMRGNIVLQSMQSMLDADMEALAAFISGVGVLASEFRGEIAEMVFDPLLVYPAGNGVRVSKMLVLLNEEIPSTLERSS